MRNNVTLIISMLMILASCNNEVENFGVGILTDSDLLDAKVYVDSVSTIGYTVKDDAYRTDGVLTALLGELNDPIFGKQKAVSLFQVRLAVHYDFPERTNVDSSFLCFKYNRIYGDTLSVHRMAIYELNEELDAYANYLSDKDYSSMKGRKIGEINFDTKYNKDTLGNVIDSVLRIPIDTDFSQQYFDLDSVDYADNDLFLKKMKGFYVESELVGGSDYGSFVKLDLSNRGSSAYIDLHFNATEYIDSLGIDSTVVDSIQLYANTLTSRITNVSREGADFTASEVLENVSSESNLYISPFGGSKARVQIPPLEDIIEGYDSLNPNQGIYLMTAQLLFTIDSTRSSLDTVSRQAPSLLMLEKVDTVGKTYPILDFYYPNGYYVQGVKYGANYVFNISRYLQRLIDGEETSREFEIHLPDYYRDGSYINSQYALFSETTPGFIATTFSFSDAYGANVVDYTNMSPEGVSLCGAGNGPGIRLSVQYAVRTNMNK
ncbi:MAG: DUF4270 family protein [Bacteroidales bacterium]